MTQLSLDPHTSALLLMDFQTSIVEMVPTDKDSLLTRTAALLDGARAAGMRIIHVVVAFRPGYPEVSPRNQSFAPIRESGRMIEGSPGTEVHPALSPRPGEVVVTKHRVGAFWGTDLEVVLKAGGIDTLILTGIATSGVVLSTVRHASDADYRVVVVGDCCADRDPEVHRVLLEKVFVRQTTITTAEAVLGAVRNAK
jgi:nicotinamidase-related amidase